MRAGGHRRVGGCRSRHTGASRPGGVNWGHVRRSQDTSAGHRAWRDGLSCLSYATGVVAESTPYRSGAEHLRPLGPRISGEEDFTYQRLPTPVLRLAPLLQGGL